MYSNTKNIHTHNGASQGNTAVLHSNEEFSGCHLNSTNTPTSIKSAPLKQSTTSVLRQWRRPDAVVDKHASTKDNNPTSEYSMYSQPLHSTAVPAYLSHAQYADSTRYSKQDARVPDGVVKYGTSVQYYQQDGGTYPGQSTPPLAHAKVISGYGEGHNYPLGNQKVSQNYPYQILNQTYQQKIQQHESKTILSDEPNAYCLKSGPYPAQNRVAQPNGHPNGQPNVSYSLPNPLDRRLSPQEPSQTYYVNKSTCQELRQGRQTYGMYGPSYLAQKPNLPSAQEQKCRDYRQIVHNPKKSPPFPILEQRLSAEGSFYPDYGPGAYAHHKYGPPVMLPAAGGQKNYLNCAGPKFPPEDIIPSTYAKYYPQNKVAYEQNHYLLQMNQMQTRLNPNLFARSTELPRDVAYMDARTHPKRCLQYNALDANQFGVKSPNVSGQKPTKIVTYGSVQDQRMGEHPSGEYFRSYAKGQSVIQSGKMQVDSYNITGRTEQDSYAYSPPLIQQSARPTLAQYPNNYRPSLKTNEVSSGNISPRRTFQENMPVVVIPSQCIGLPKVSPQYSLPGQQEYSQMYQNYLPKESYYPGANAKPGSVQYRNEQVVKQPVHVSRNILPSYAGAQYQHSSPEGVSSIYAPEYRAYETSAYSKTEVDIGKSLKEYLESWEDDEDIVTNLPDVVLCNNIPADKQKHVSFSEPIAEARANSSAPKPTEEDTLTQQPLYILDSTNISSEALSQYLHIQQIDHLPANIKGYYRLPGVAEPLEKPLPPAVEQKLENSKEPHLKVADLPRQQSEELRQVVDNGESTVGKLETQAQRAEDYSKTSELNLLEATELCIPEISAELVETSAENASPQDYSVNKRGTTEIAEASGFQQCLPQDFSIARKIEQLTIAAEDIAQNYSITKPNERLHLPETAVENTPEASVIQANTTEDYKELLQEDVALNLSTNRSKLDDNSEDTHLLTEILREADSSIIEESTNTMCASKLQAVLQRSNEERDESKVSSSNTRNSQPVAKTFAAQLNEDVSRCIEATARIEEYLEIEHGDAKFNEPKQPAVIQIHTASVIVQNTFFDDKSGSKTLSEPVKKSNQEVENDRSAFNSDPASLQADVSCISLRSDSPQQLTNRIGSNQVGHGEETTVAEDEPRTYSSLVPCCNKSPLSSDLSKSVDNPCYKSFEPSDFEPEVKTYRKQSLLEDYNKQKLEEDSSERSSSESSADEDEDYSKQRTEIERKYDRCSENETSASEDCEVFTSDNSDEDEGEFDKERAEDSSTEDTNKYSKIRSSTNKETTTQEDLDQSTGEEQNIQDESTPGTPNDLGTDTQDETNQSTATKNTDEPAQSTAEVKSTSGQDESSQSTVRDSNLEDSSTARDQGTIRIEELAGKQESTTKLEELSGSTTGKDGTTPGDDNAGTTDKETTIIQAEAKEIGTTESVLHQSTDEVVQYNECTIDNQQVLEENLKENTDNNSPLHQEIATDSIGTKEDCKNLACGNKTVQQSSRDNASNNSSTSLQAHNLATCNNCRESVQDLAASQRCNKVATSCDNYQETEGEYSGEYVDLHQQCKMDAIIEENTTSYDNHEDITSVDNQITSSSQSWSEESEDTRDYNQSQHTDLYSEDCSLLGNSTAESEDCNLQTNTRESEDTDTKLVIDKEECNSATLQLKDAEEDGRRSSLAADRDLHGAETECNSADDDSDLDVDLQSEDVDLQSEEASLQAEEASLQTEASTLQALLSDDPTVESEDLTVHSEDTLLETNTIEAEIICEEASLPVEELKTPISLMDNEDNSSALSDRCTLSSDNLISIDNNKQLATDSFELEMENIFKNISQDPVVPETYPRSTNEDCIQAEAAESIDHLKLHTMDASASQLETDNSRRMVAETSRQCGSSFEGHSSEMADLSSKDSSNDLATTDDETSRVTVVPAVTLPANLLPADDCLVIFSAADDFVILQEPETVSVETIIEEQDIEELVDRQLDTEPEPRAVSVEQVEELIARQMSTADEDADEIIDSIRANPLDKDLNKHSLDEKQEIVDNSSKKNQTEILVNDSVTCEELQPTVEEIQVQLIAETQLQLVSEIEIVEQCLEDVKHEIKEESSTEQQQQETEDVVTIEEFKEEIVNLEKHPAEVKFKERSENVDFKEELPDYKKNMDNTDDIVATSEDKQPGERVKEDLLTTDTVSDEKMKVELKIEGKESDKEELEEGELSDQSDDWDELLGSVQLPAPPISQEKKLLFARRKKNLEKLKAKLLLAQHIHKSAGKITEESLQPSSAQHKPQGASSEDASLVQRLLPSHESKSSSSTATTSADTSSKRTVVEPAPKDHFQLPPVFKRYGASVEDKELFINPENPQYQSTNVRSLDILASRKRSLSYTDYSSPKIEFTAPKRRYSVLEIARPLRRPIINLDEISQNISRVLKRLDSTENQRKLTYKQRTASKNTSERVENERQSRETNIPKPNQLATDKCEQKPALKKLDQFKLYEKMMLQKSLEVLPVKLYEDEECVVNDNSATSVLESPEELVQSLDSDQTFGTNTYPTSALREGPQLEATTSAQVFKPLERVDSAHHLAKPLQSNTPAVVVVKPTLQFDSSQLFVASANDVTNMEADLVECSGGIASSHQLYGGGQNDPLADVPSTLVDPVLVLSKVSYNPRTTKICGGQVKQKMKIAIGTKLCRNASERRPAAHVASKEHSQQKQIHLEETKVNKNNLSEMQKDNVTVENRIEKAGSEEQSSPAKMPGKQAADRWKPQGRNEDWQAKIKGVDGRRKVGISNSDSQTLKAKKEDSQTLEAKKEDSQTLEANKEDSQRLEAKKEDSQTLEANKEDSQTLKAKKEDSQTLQAKKEDSQKVEANKEDSQTLEANKEDSQKLEANKEDSQTLQVTDEDCPTIVERRKEDPNIEERKEDSQLEVQRREDENPRIKDNQKEINTDEDKREECIKPEKITRCIVQSDKNNSHSVRSGDLSSTNLFTVDTSTAKSSTAVGRTRLDTSLLKPDDSTDLLANSSTSEAVLSNITTVSSNVPTLNMKVEPAKSQVASSNARRQLQERQRTVVSVKSGKLNAIIASLQASRSAKTIASSFERMKGKKDPSPSVNRGSLSGDLEESLAGSTAATVDQPAAVEGKTSIGDDLVSGGKHVSPESELSAAVDQVSARVDLQYATVKQCTATVGQVIAPGQQITSVNGTKVPLVDPHTIIQECSPKITNTSTTVQCSTLPKACTGLTVSPLLHNIAYNIASVGSSAYKDASKVEAVSGKLPVPSSSNAPSVSVIVKPTAAKRRNEVKKTDGIDNKLANTFRLTEYTKSYIKLKMSEEMNTNIASGLKQSDQQLPGQAPVKQLKRKLPNCETDTTISTAPDKRVKINLQDYRNRKQHGICPIETRIDTGHCKNDNGSFDDCLGEVVDDFMTVIEADEQYSVANEIGSEFRRSSNLGMEIYMDDSMELIPGNEEIVHTSREEDVRENSGADEDVSENEDRININAIHRPPTGARKMRIRMLCTPDSAIDQARFEDISYPGPSNIEDDPEMNSLPKTAITAKETNTNTLTRQRIKSKGEMKMYRPKRRKKRFRNLYTTDEDEDSEVPTVLPNDLTPASGQCREEIHDSSGASPEDYSHLVAVEPASKKHVVRGEESQETTASASSGAVDDLGPLSRRQGYQHRSHKRDKAKNTDGLPSSSASSKAFSGKLEYKCHINLNALGRKCNMLTADPIQPSTSKLGLKLTLKSVQKQNVPDSTSTTARRYKHGKRKVPRTEHSAYSVSTSVANDKVPKVIIKRNGSGYCAVSRDVSTNPIWQPVIRVRRQRYIESLVRVQGGSVP